MVKYSVAVTCVVAVVAGVFGFSWHMRHVAEGLVQSGAVIPLTTRLGIGFANFWMAFHWLGVPALLLVALLVAATLPSRARS